MAADERAEASASDPLAPEQANETLDAGPTLTGMTRAEMEAAALEADRLPADSQAGRPCACFAKAR